MSNGINNLVREVSPKSLFESAIDLIDATSTWLQGDLLIRDPATYLLRKPASEAECTDFCGIAVQTIVDGKAPSPVQGTMVDAAEGNDDIKGPVYGCIFSLILKTGDALNPGDVVYADPASGSRNVSATGTKAIGVYQGAAIASATAGQEILVLVGARAPSDALIF
jgi:hypothetical protein